MKGGTRIVTLTISSALVLLGAGSWAALRTGSASPPSRPEAGPTVEQAVLGPPAPEPSQAEAERAAKETCESRLSRYEAGGNAEGLELAAAYPTNSGDVAAEEERRRTGSFRSQFRDRPPEEFLALCFFDADAFGVPGGSGRPPPGVHTRLEEIVRSDGTPYVLGAGRTDTVDTKPIPREQRVDP